MGLVLALAVGLIIGVIAKFLMPGRDGGGIIVTSLLGIAGSVTANYLGHSMGMYRRGEHVGVIASVFGAMLLLAVYRMFRGNRDRDGN